MTQADVLATTTIFRLVKKRIFSSTSYMNYPFWEWPVHDISTLIMLLGTYLKRMLEER